MNRSDRPTQGKIQELYHDGKYAQFEWRIPNRQSNYNYCTPAVKYFNMIWYFEIFKARNRFSRLYVSRERATSGILETVCFSMTYNKANGREETIAFEETILKGHRGCLVHIDLPVETALLELTITCYLSNMDSPSSETVSHVTQIDNASCTGGRIERPLKGVSREAQTEEASCTNCLNNEQVNSVATDIAILSEHFEDLLMSGDDHDFLIKVKEKQFRAHKCVLRARSPVFAAMFRSQMAESADASVTIDDCEPDAFGEFLRYLYTGKVDISSTSRALGLYYAGDKYDFPRLKGMCVEFLKNSLAATTISDVLTLAARHDEEVLLQQALVFLATHLEEVMITVEWQRFVQANPIQGNEMCIRALQSLKKC